MKIIRCLLYIQVVLHLSISIMLGADSSDRIKIELNPEKETSKSSKVLSFPDTSYRIFTDEGIIGYGGGGSYIVGGLFKGKQWKKKLPDGFSCVGGISKMAKFIFFPIKYENEKNNCDIVGYLASDNGEISQINGLALGVNERLYGRCSWRQFDSTGINQLYLLSYFFRKTPTGGETVVRVERFTEDVMTFKFVAEDLLKDSDQIMELRDFCSSLGNNRCYDDINKRSYLVPVVPNSLIWSEAARYNFVRNNPNASIEKVLRPDFPKIIERPASSKDNLPYVVNPSGEILHAYNLKANVVNVFDLMLSKETSFYVSGVARAIIMERERERTDRAYFLEASNAFVICGDLITLIVVEGGRLSRCYYVAFSPGLVGNVNLSMAKDKYILDIFSRSSVFRYEVSR